MWGWMTDENDCEWQTQSQGQKLEKQSGWQAQLSRKGGCKKMSFKFLVLLRLWRKVNCVGEFCYRGEMIRSGGLLARPAPSCTHKLIGIHRQSGQNQSFYSSEQKSNRWFVFLRFANRFVCLAIACLLEDSRTTHHGVKKVKQQTRNCTRQPWACSLCWMNHCHPIWILRSAPLQLYSSLYRTAIANRVAQST